MIGKLYGIGVGPGDPELLTLKAARLLESCSVIAIPAKDAASCTAWRIAEQAVPSIVKKEVLAVPVPMTTEKNRLEAAYREGCAALAEKLEDGKDIAFLNLGDPSVYGSYMEFHKRMLAAGYAAEVISGVPSFCAVAAALDCALGDGEEMIHILPGCYGIEDMEGLSGTKILMKSGHRLGQIREALEVMEKAGKQKACAVSNCGMNGERICRSMEELPEEAGYFTTILVKDA